MKMNSSELCQKIEGLESDLKSSDDRLSLLTSRLQWQNVDPKDRHPAVRELSTRARNSFARENLGWVFELETLTAKDVIKMPEIGIKTFKEIEAWMQRHGLSFKETENEYHRRLRDRASEKDAHQTRLVL